MFLQYMATTFIQDRNRYLFLSPNSPHAYKVNGDMNSHIQFKDVKIIDSANTSQLYASISIQHAEFPYSFYSIDSDNCTLQINSTTIQIEHGFYTAYTLQDFINANNPLSSSFLSLNTSNGCYKMTYTSAFTIQGTVLECMGLTNATYNALFDGTNFVIQFTKSVNLIRTRNLHIITPNLLYDNYNVATQSSTDLRSIQVNVPPFSIINYSNTDNSASVIYNADVNDLIIQIRDDNNNFIDFNGQEWSMCIAIKTTNQAVKIHGSIQ